MELVKMENNNVVTTSLTVAEVFGKEHKHVIERIRRLEEDISTAENSAVLFQETEYIATNGKSNKMYHMTRDGLTLLAMGFNGQKALQWKLKYMEAFNKMEEMLKKVKEEQNNIPNDYMMKFVEQTTKMMEQMTATMAVMTNIMSKNTEVNTKSEEIKPKTKREELKELVQKIKKGRLASGGKWTILYDRIKKDKGIDVRKAARQNLLDWIEKNGYLEECIKTAKLIIAEQEA